MIYLKDRAPVAAGNNSEVYRHPEDETTLVKVVKPEAIARANTRWDFFRGRRRRYFHLKNFMRVLEEQIAVLAAEGRASPHLEEVIGLVETDLGPGLMVRCETYQGEIAPTLHKIMTDGGLKDHMRQPLEAFLAWLEASPIVANDTGVGNMVLSDRRDGELRVVMIDGYGETAAIPLKSWSRWLNRHDKRRKCDSLRRRLNLL